ncbi:MAG TPA: hypothetical protein VJ757_05340 [Pseudonocardiaceae bacterium]|nr:hypothetical protein [Pseudonocardiaceae bacterium]
MQWITVATPSFASLEQVDAVIAQLDGPPEGMAARYIGTTGDGELRVVALWESRAHAERFCRETRPCGGQNTRPRAQRCI